MTEEYQRSLDFWQKVFLCAEDRSFCLAEGRNREKKDLFSRQKGINIRRKISCFLTRHLL